MMTPSNGNIFRVTGPLCGDSPVTGEFPSQRPVTRSFDVFFHLRLNKWLSEQSWGWWSETLSRSLWRHCNVKDSKRWGLIDRTRVFAFWWCLVLSNSLILMVYFVVNGHSHHCPRVNEATLGNMHIYIYIYMHAMHNPLNIWADYVNTRHSTTNPSAFSWDI